MVGFGGILMKDKLIDGKKLWVGLEANWLRWLKMLVVNLIIIQSHALGLWINWKTFFH